jgi:cytochrome c
MRGASMRATVFAPAMALALLCQSGALLANEALADQNACLNCHQVAKKSIGPTFKAIAAKYKGQASAQTALAEKITKGGAGAWGAVPMPAMADVPPAELKQIVSWILAQ